MNVKGKSGISDLYAVSEALKEVKEQGAERLSKRKGDLEQTERPVSEKLDPQDKIHINVSKAIQAELDPEAMLRTRREKVEHLRKLVQAREYNPNLNDVARATGEEISLAIIFEKGLDK